MIDSPAEPDAALPAPPTPGVDGAWALFLDVDGTVLDFAARPDAVRVGGRLHETLSRLHARLGGALALLSGRTLREIDALFDWHARAAAGLHGAQWRCPDGREHGIRRNPAFDVLRSDAATSIAGFAGVLFEDKTHALALHYRNAPAQSGAVERLAQRLLENAGNDYILQRGDHVIELKPAGADKGCALAALMQSSSFRGRTPWMLGDDLTDEDAFARVNTMHGVSVIVGARRPTRACHALADPAAARAWLGAIAQRNPQGEAP
ncbi:MAG: trehalose-phosphatase [Rhodanobacteraceae bacterium]